MVLDEAHKPVQVGTLKEWQNLQLGVFQNGNFGQKLLLFHGYDVDFLGTGVIKELECAWKEAMTLR